MVIRPYAPSRTSRLAAAAASALVTLGLLVAVTATFQDSKAVQIAKAESVRVLAVAGAK